jgi:hypothetical protein
LSLGFNDPAGMVSEPRSPELSSSTMTRGDAALTGMVSEPPLPHF